MSRLSRKEKLRRYHAIYDQIYTNPRVHVHEISKNLKIARNTVSSYLDHMYESGKLFGPELRLKYYSGLSKYMYLVRFDDPYAAFDRLQKDPNVEYASMYFGDWNMMIISDGDYDVSQVPGFENLLFKGERYDITTPRTPLRNWNTAFQKMRDEISEFRLNKVDDPDYTTRNPPDWDEEEWKLFNEYQYDFRKKVTPVLRKHLISSDKFYRWMDTLPNKVNVIMRFYSDGATSYTHFGFFFKTQYPETVTTILSNLPTSINSTYIEGGLVAVVSIKSDVTSTFLNLFSTLHEMKTKDIVDKFYQAIFGAVYYIKENGEE